MKYNTISSSSLASEGKKSSFTIYADMDIPQTKMEDTKSEIQTVRDELEIVQKALKLQTKRCRQLVAEYTRKLQEKELQYYSEKMLRDDQLAKVLKALLIFEARLRQEQKFISHQLNEKDYIITKQNNDIKKLLSNQYCKNCNQYYTSSPVQESLDSSSEYVVTDYQDYQSSNFESLDSSSETYATLSENMDKSDSPYLIEDNTKPKTESTKTIYKKNRNTDSYGRRSKKHQHRKSIGTYFEVLKLRNESTSSASNEDNTSNDYDNLDSLPSEIITEKITLTSENIENIFNQNLTNADNSLSEYNDTVIDNNPPLITNTVVVNAVNVVNDTTLEKKSQISDAIPVFDDGNGETNDNWYASASDQEDDERRDVYRNNPVLECMNQILLQNINDPLNSPPKTPNIERKTVKNNKRVKFSDEDETPEAPLTKENLQRETNNTQQDYYETPVQKVPNYYETPQSIYSNDYEQILSKCGSDVATNNEMDQPKPTDNHVYVDMEQKPEKTEDNANKIIRKSKILRTPPALPPKPANLASKFKIQQKPDHPEKPIKDKNTDTSSEPDYCSISELNLPPTKNLSFQKISVVAEINSPSSNDVRNKLEKADTSPIKPSKKSQDTDYDPVIVKDNVPNLVVKKCVEKFNIQVAKQTPIKSEASTAVPKSPKKIEPEIPKLPQVSEIIIPDENEEVKEQAERISHDNYVKNNSQIFKIKNNDSRQSIVIGSSVSSLITGFNNKQLLSEINKKPERTKLDKKMFSSFENLQNLDKHGSHGKEQKKETPSFENYDLSQNFEEFKLDDCDIEEYDVEDDFKTNEAPQVKPESPSKIKSGSDIIIPSLNRSSIEMFRMELQRTQNKNRESMKKDGSFKAGSEPTYEHFLECTGLSSKSILTPSRFLSNHKSMLKPKDVKLRSKVKANNLIERQSTSAIKYWSEPFI